MGLCAVFAADCALAACRVTDFSSAPLASLEEVQRLSFVQQMTQTEYDRLKQLKPGDPDYYSIIADSASRIEPRKAAREKLDGVQVVASPADLLQATPYRSAGAYAAIWASDWLSDDQLRKFVACSSNRRPGLVYAGRLADPKTFSLSFAHLTPIGIEKIRLRVVASRNIANIEDFQAFLDKLGDRDNFGACAAQRGAVRVCSARWHDNVFLLGRHARRQSR